MPEMVSITLDGKQVQVPGGVKLIEALEAAGTYVPRFCYHPRMRPVGVCRMCLVEVSGPRGFSLQPSCFIDVADQLEVRTTSEAVRKAQHGVLEFLLLNHPLDCPVCDKGGECPLQDQAFAHGPGETRFLEEKRHYPKPIPVSSLVLLDRERCIQCDRCTRFADEIAGEPNLDFAGRGNGLRVSIFEGRAFDSVFSGNVVQICPVGALTATPYRFKARPWDLAEVASTCQECALGCQVALQSSQNELTRVLGIDADTINQSWLCDRGRFQVAAINNREARLRAPRVEGNLATWPQALDAVASLIADTVARQGSGAVGVLGGDRLGLEDQFAWARLARSVIQTSRVDGVGSRLVDPQLWWGRLGTLADIDSAEVVVTLNVDVREELPVAWIRLRQRALARGGVIDLASVPTSQGAFAERIGLDPANPRAALQQLAEAVGERRALVIAGSSNQLLDVAAQRALVASVLEVLGEATVLPVHRGPNAAGALVAGLAPGWWPALLAEAPAGWIQSAGAQERAILEAARTGALGLLIVLDLDLVECGLEPAEVASLARAVPIVALSRYETTTTGVATIALPLAAWGETRGLAINLELRLLRLGAGVEPMEQAWPGWSVAEELRHRLQAGSVAVAAGEVVTDLVELGGVLGSHDVHQLALRVAGPLLPSHQRDEGAPARLLDPMATPGVASVRRQAPDVRLGDVLDPASPRPAPGLRRRELVRVQLTPEEPPAAGTGAGLVAWLRSPLYDGSPSMRANPYLEPLRPASTARMAPADATRLGLHEAERVMVAGRLEVPLALDDTVTPGVVALEGVVEGWLGLVSPSGWARVEVEAVHGR